MLLAILTNGKIIPPVSVQPPVEVVTAQLWCKVDFLKRFRPNEWGAPDMTVFDLFGQEDCGHHVVLFRRHDNVCGV